MRKEEEVNSPRSCLNQAENLEPIFVIVGDDAAAIPTINAWIREAYRMGAPSAKIEAARESVKLFTEWQLNHPGRVHVPD